MMRPRLTKVFADLWGNKIRSVLVVASIAIGLFAVGLITSIYVILIEDMETGYQQVNPANIYLSATAFDEEVVKRIERLDQVAAAEGYRALRVRVRVGPDKWKPLDIKAIPDIEAMQINQVQLEAGSWPPADRELVVDNHKLDELNAQPGDLVEIELPSGKIRQLRLVGVVKDQSIGATVPGGFFVAPAQGYLTLDTLEWLEQPRAMNRMLVTVTGDPNDLGGIRSTANWVSDEIEQAGRVVLSSDVRQSRDHPNRVYVQAIASVLFLLGFLVVFLSAFLITNTLSALLNQQVNQIGVMKTLGARRLQIIGIYMALIFIYSLVAFLIAAPLSSQAAYAMVVFLTREINMKALGFRTVPVAILLQLGIALLAPQVAGIFPILHGTRISTVEALSGYSQEKPPSPNGWLDQRIKKIQRLSRPILLSLRNTFRRRGRLILTLFTLTLGGAIFIATFNVQGSLSKYIERIGSYFRADVNITLGRDYRVSEVMQALEDMPEIDWIEAWTASAAEVVLPDGSVAESLSILAPPAGSRLVEPILIKGRWVQPGDQATIAVNERFLDLLPGLQPGDTLRLRIRGKEVDVEVVGVFQLSGRSGGYIAYTNYEYLSELIHQPNKANTFRVTSPHPDLSLEEQEALGKAIETRLEDRGFSVAEITEGRSLIASTADGLNVLTAFLILMASMIAIVGSIGLTGTMSLNVMERVREIGVMRAIGASDRAVMNMVMVEGLTIGMLSWIFGTLLAFPISTLLSNAINLALFGALAEFTFTPAGVILWLVVVLVLSSLASIMPARNAAKLTIREILAYE